MNLENEIREIFNKDLLTQEDVYRANEMIRKWKHLYAKNLMSVILRRHDSATHYDYLILENGDNVFLMPKFDHLMMDNRLIEVEIPQDYYNINREAINIMIENTKNYINEKRKQTSN